MGDVVTPLDRRAKFKRLHIASADWVSDPGGVYPGVGPLDVAGGSIQATIAAGCATAGNPASMGLVAWSMTDQDGHPITGNDDATYRIETLVEIVTAPPNASNVCYAFGLCTHSTAALFRAAGTSCHVGAGSNWAPAGAPRGMETFKVKGGGLNTFNVGSAGGNAHVFMYGDMPIVTASGRLTRTRELWETSALAYATDSTSNIQVDVFGTLPCVSPERYRLFLALGSFTGAVPVNSIIELRLYYRATRLGKAPPI